MIIRSAAPDDLPAYFDHAQRHFAESGQDGDLIFHPILDFAGHVRTEEIAKTLDALNTPLDRPGWQRIWIAELGGEVVADVILRSGFMPATLHRCQFGIGVERSVRGMGLGRRLSLQALAWARQQSELAWMDLWVFAHNGPAIALYEKLGFRRLDTVVDQFRVQGQSVDDIHMTLSLAR